MADYIVGETIYHTFTTRAFASGIPTVLAGSPVLSVIEDNSATPITAGLTLGVSHASVVGLNLITVVATGGNGFEAGKQYTVYISTGTVGGVSVVGEHVWSFGLGVEAAFTRLGAPVGASISADVAAVKAETVLILADTAVIGAAGAGLTDLGGMATAMKAEVKAEADQALTDYGGPTKTEMDTAHGLLSTTADLLDKLGAVNEAAAAGDPSTTESVMQYVKQIVNILAGAAGVVTYPSEAGPGNGVSLAEVISAIHADVTGLAGSAMRGTDSAALASVLGALNDAAADGDPTTGDTAMQYIKQLINVLIGAAGIVAWPAAADPGNGVSIAEALRRVFDDTDQLVFTVANQVDANAVAISGDTVSADNLELQYDTTGLAGDTFPATQSQLGQIEATGSSTHQVASSYVLTTGTQSSGTVASTIPLDGTNHEHTDVGNALDLYYQFLIGAGIPQSVEIHGYLNGNNDDLEVYGFDWVTSAWVQIGTLNGKAASTNEVHNFTMFISMVGTGANEGIVRVRFTDGAFTLSTATLAIDQIFIAFALGGSVGYDNGSIWIDTAISNTNTVVGIDGTARNPVSTIAAALTLSASTNLKKFEVAPGSTITLGATFSGLEMQGFEWILDLSGEDISGSEFIGASVSGIGTGTGTTEFKDCFMGATTIPAGTHIIDSDFEGTITLGAAGTFYFENCTHGSPSPAILDFGSGLNSSVVHLHPFNGGLEIQNMGAGTGSYVIHLNGDGRLTLNANCSATSTINIAGNWDVTDNASGAVTLNDDARYDVAQVNAEVDTALTDYAGPTKAEMDTAHGLLATPAQVNTEVDNALDTAIPGSPTANSVNQRLVAVDDLTQSGGGGDLAAILGDTNELQADDTPTSIAAVQTTVDAIETDTQDIQGRLPSALVGGRIDATVDGTGMESGAVDAILQRQMTEGYNTDGTAPTLEQAMMGILQALTEFAISGTTITVKKLDGSATAMTFTLDDDTSPTSRTRAT